MTIIGTLPNNIQDGQVADAAPIMADFNFIVNQVNANALQNNFVPTGTLLNVRTITTTGTYTPTVGTSRIFVMLQGPGGGGAGAVATTGSQTSAAGGGGAGGFCSAFLTTGFSGVTITLPSGGAGGAAGSGGATAAPATFGAIMTANSGAGGSVAAGANAFGVGGAGGTAAGGTLNIQGTQGGLTDANQSYALYHTVQGGNSLYGAGGIAVASNAAGAPGTGFGSGGGGTISAPSTSTGVTGGNGAQSLCVIYEYS
jgi:hypothetical protein